MADKTGKSFETLTHQIFELLSKDDRYTSVEHDVQLDSPYGNRQIDVLLRSQVAGLDILTVVECKDFKKNLSIEYVDNLASKMEDVGANKAVLVARKGFSKNAKRKAARLGITLCTAHDVSNMSALEGIGLKFPVLMKEVLPELELQVQASFKSSTGTSISRDAVMRISDVDAFDYMTRAIKSDTIPLESSMVVGGHKPNFKEPPFIRDVRGEKLAVEDVEIHYRIGVKFFIGDVSELPKSVALNNLSDEQATLFVNGEDIVAYKEHLQEVPVPPKIRGLCIAGCSVPDWGKGSYKGEVSIRELKDGE